MTPNPNQSVNGPTWDRQYLASFSASHNGRRDASGPRHTANSGHEKKGLALHESGDESGLVQPEDGIAFPVANSCLLIYDVRTFVDARAKGNHSHLKKKRNIGTIMVRCIYLLSKG